MSLAPDHSRHTIADPVEAFKLRCWARAKLYANGEFDLIEAVDALQAFAIKLGLVAEFGQDAVQAMMAAAFTPVRAAEFQNDKARKVAEEFHHAASAAPI